MPSIILDKSPIWVGSVPDSIVSCSVRPLVMLLISPISDGSVPEIRVPWMRGSPMRDVRRVKMLKSSVASTGSRWFGYESSSASVPLSWVLDTSNNARSRRLLYSSGSVPLTRVPLIEMKASFESEASTRGSVPLRLVSPTAKPWRSCVRLPSSEGRVPEM